MTDLAPARRATGGHDPMHVDLQLIGVRDEVLQGLGRIEAALGVELRALNEQQHNGTRGVLFESKWSERASASVR